MTDILVDPDKLRWGATVIERVAGDADAAVRDLNIPTLVEGINPEYAVELATKVRSYGAQLVGQTAPIINGLQEHSAWLRELARRFEEADQASVQGMERLWASSQALIADYGETPFVPLWLLDGTRPPWIDAEAWAHLGMQERLAMTGEYRRDWANFMTSRTEGSFRSPIISGGYLEELFMIYMFGLPAHLLREVRGEDNEGRVRIEQVRPYDPDYELFSRPDMPDGRQYGYPHWQDQDLVQTMDNAGLPDTIDPRIWDDWSRYHLNLCGLDAVGHAVGLEHMSQAYIEFARIREPMLINNDVAWVTELDTLYERLGWDAGTIGPFAGSDFHWNGWENNALVMPSFEQVNAHLNDGYALTALVGVNPASGVLSSQDAAVGHFVNILETMSTREGTALVRVYNSMWHREEIYTWDHFSDTWSQAGGGGNASGQAILAQPAEGAP